MGNVPTKESLASRFFDDAKETHRQPGSSDEEQQQQPNGSSMQVDESMEGERKTPTLWKNVTSMASRGWNNLTNAENAAAEPSEADPYELNRIAYCFFSICPFT